MRIARDGAPAPDEEAIDWVDAIAVGLDLTARDVQARAKQAGEPWAVAKGFDGAAPVSAWIAAAELESWRTARARMQLECSVNGELRQHGELGQMLFGVDELIRFCASRFSWRAGDLLFTGTPAGVGPLRAGDHVAACLREQAEASPVCALELAVTRQP